MCRSSSQRAEDLPPEPGRACLAPPREPAGGHRSPPPPRDPPGTRRGGSRPGSRAAKEGASDAAGRTPASATRPGRLGHSPLPRIPCRNRGRQRIAAAAGPDLATCRRSARPAASRPSGNGRRDPGRLRPRLCAPARPDDLALGRGGPRRRRCDRLGVPAASAAGRPARRHAPDPTRAGIRQRGDNLGGAATAGRPAPAISEGGTGRGHPGLALEARATAADRRVAAGRGPARILPIPRSRSDRPATTPGSFGDPACWPT